jgi:outer membrane protein assembly factor BamE (lipoprotein component of BamABCDE complex)
MKNRLLSLLGCAVLGLAVTVGTTACDKQGNAKITDSLNTKITPANVAKLQKGMDRTQVEALFGQPTKVGEVENDVIFKKQTNTWVEGKESLSVTFKNNEVETFNSTVGSTTSTTSTDGQTSTTTTSTTNSQ